MHSSTCLNRAAAALEAVTGGSHESSCYTQVLEAHAKPVKVTLERLPESRVLLDIEVDAERLEKSLQAAYKRVANRARIPGFRPGKAPRPIVERMIGREGLIREALDDLVPLAYNEVLEEQALNAVDQPELEIVELDPVRFKATVPVRHTAELGDYQSIKIEREAVEVTPELIDEQLLHLRERFAAQVPVERPVAWGDFLIADVIARVEGESFIDDHDAEFRLREGDVLFLPGLADAFVGMEAGVEKQFDLVIPDDFHVERVHGKTANFTLTVKEIKEAVLPDLDDDFAQQVSDTDFPTLASLRERVEKDARESLEKAADSRVHQEAVDQMLAMATLDYPRVYVEREIDALVKENLGADRDRYLTYLSHLGQSEADYRASLSEAADTRVKRSIIIAAFTEAEGVEVADDEIEAELDKLVEPAGEHAAAMRQILNSEEGREALRRSLLSDRTMERLKTIVTSGAKTSETTTTPEASAEEPKPAARPRRTRKKEEDSE